jgi:hypothetical protein
MCAKQWDAIDFTKVPSLAMKRYTNTFQKNSQETFENYKEKLANGEAKINASAIYPYDIKHEEMK